MKRYALAAVLGAAAALVAKIALAQASDDPLDPVKVAGHPHGLSVYFTDWDARVTADGQAAESRHRTAGTFAWSEAIVHTVENVGKTEGHILRIELKL